MIELKQIRAVALALAGVEEGPPVRAARRIAAFKVAGKSFLGIETGGLTMTLSLSEDDARALAVERPDIYEEIRREGKLLGLRVSLVKISVGKMEELIRKSWEYAAAKAHTRKSAR